VYVRVPAFVRRGNAIDRYDEVVGRLIFGYSQKRSILRARFGNERPIGGDVGCGRPIKSVTTVVVGFTFGPANELTFRVRNDGREGGLRWRCDIRMCDREDRKSTRLNSSHVKTSYA